MRALAEWCQENNLSLNVNKMKELIVDFRKQQREYHIDGTTLSPRWKVPCSLAYTSLTI